jgi:hypothetical protein
MKNNIILSIIAILLVVAAIVGIVALYRNVDSAFDTVKTDETTSSTGTSGNKPDTEKSPSETTDSSVETSKPSTDYVSDDFYINEQTQTGYRTIGNITYFFKIIEPFYNPDYNACNRCVWIKKNDIKAYSSYEVNLEYSHDSIQWDSCTDDLSWDDYGFQEFIKDDKSVLYVSYTQIANCTNRAYVLSDLNANVFYDSSIFNYEVIWAAG